MTSGSSYIPYGRQSINADDVKAVVRCLKSSYLTQGPKPEEFEESIKKATGAPHAVAVASGTAALHLAVLGMNLKPDDEVITTPITFLATSNCVLYAGAKPIFADVDPQTGNLDLNAAAEKINRRTKGIIVTHFAGQPADLSGFSKLCRKHNLFLIEDAAHALGAVYHGSSVGNGQWSDAAIWSFHPVKHITTAEGGALTTSNKKQADLWRRLRTHGVTREPALLSRKSPGRWYYEMLELGFHYRMTDLQAALGISQIAKLKDFISRRREIAAYYRRLLSDCPLLGLPPEISATEHAYHLFPVRLLTARLRQHKSAIFEEMHAAGIGLQVHYIPIPQQPYYRSLGYSMRDLPIAAQYYDAELSLPMYPSMTDFQVTKVVKNLKRIINQY